MLTRAAFRAFSLCVVCWGFLTGLAAADQLRILNPLRIVTLGDSITKGVRPGVTAEETFAAELQRQLRANGHPDAEVVNVGVGGETAGQGLKRLWKDVDAKGPKIVTIMYGHNDSYVDAGKTEPRVSISRFRADLSQLVQWLRKSDITPILMTPPAYAEKSQPNGMGEHCNVKLAQYAEVARQVAETLQVPLIDHYAAWAEVSKSGTDLNEWTTDGYHPNPKGHVDLATRMLPVVRGVIPPESFGSVPAQKWPELTAKLSVGSCLRHPGFVIFQETGTGERELRFPRLCNVVRGVRWDKGTLSLSQTPTEWTIKLKADVPRDAAISLDVDGMPRMLAAPPVSRPGPDGVITLSARDAVVHGEKLQFEPLTHKNTVGYWVNPKDYAEWSYALDTPGEFEVEIMQGCGGHAGSDVELGFKEGAVPFVVEETGHFQNFVWRKIGKITLHEPGVQTVSLKCTKLAKGAVMDMRQVRLVPFSTAIAGPQEMRDIPPDLVPPLPTFEEPVPGHRSYITRGMGNFGHTLYLPTDWNPNRQWPVLVELPGNGGYRDARGDSCGGRPVWR